MKVINYIIIIAVEDVVALTQQLLVNESVVGSMPNMNNEGLSLPGSGYKRERESGVEFRTSICSNLDK